MDCRTFRETFSEFVDGQLPEEEEVRVHEHLGGCACCRRFDRAYRAGVRALHGLPRVGPSRGFGVRLLHRVRREPPVPVLAGVYGFGGALLIVTLAGTLALDLAERRKARSDVEIGLVEEVSAPPAEAVDRAADLITVHVIRGGIDLPQPDPYAALPSPEWYDASRIRFDVPAVWSGR